MDFHPEVYDCRLQAAFLVISLEKHYSAELLCSKS